MRGDPLDELLLDPAEHAHRGDHLGVAAGRFHQFGLRTAGAVEFARRLPRGHLVGKHQQEDQYAAAERQQSKRAVEEKQR